MASVLHIYFGKVTSAPEAICNLEHTLRSHSITKKTEVTLFRPRPSFLAILDIQASAGHAPGTVGHWGIY